MVLSAADYDPAVAELRSPTRAGAKADATRFAGIHTLS
jgi:hypothetical protein